MMFRHSPPSFGAGSAFWHLASGRRMRQNYISGKSSGLEAVLPGYTRVCGRRSVGRGGCAARTGGGREGCARGRRADRGARRFGGKLGGPLRGVGRLHPHAARCGRLPGERAARRLLRTERPPHPRRGGAGNHAGGQFRPRGFSDHRCRRRAFAGRSGRDAEGRAALRDGCQRGPLSSQSQFTERHQAHAGRRAGRHRLDALRRRRGKPGALPAERV